MPTGPSPSPRGPWQETQKFSNWILPRAGSGVADAQKPPVEFGPDKNLKWKVPAPAGALGAAAGAWGAGEGAGAGADGCAGADGGEESEQASAAQAAPSASSPSQALISSPSCRLDRAA